MGGEAPVGGRSVSSQVQKRLQPDETVQLVTQMDLRSLVVARIGYTLLTAFFGIFVAGFAFGFTAPFLGVVVGGIIGFVVWLFVALSPVILGVLIMKFGAFEYVITDRRFVKVKDTLFSSDEESVRLDRVRDVEYDEDFLDKILGTGDIRVEGTRGDTLTLNNTPDAEKFYQSAQKIIHEIDQVDEYNGGGGQPTEETKEVDIGDLL